MHRRLTKGACGPLLGACVLIAVVWAGSYRSFAMVQPGVSAGATRWALISYRGLLAVSVMPNYPVSSAASVSVQDASREHAIRWDDQYWSASYGGLCAEDGHVSVEAADGSSVDRTWCALVLPYWMMMALAALGPALALGGILRARLRAARGECVQCGYVMVGDVCPACAARSAVIGLTPRTHLLSGH